MGLEDRDYMRERRPSDIDFRPPRRRATAGWVVAVASCAILIGLYFGAGRYLGHRATPEDAPRRAEGAAIRADSRADRRHESGHSPAAAGRPADASPTGRPATVRIVSKCVDPQGRTSYSDDQCSAGSRASRVEIHSDVNVAKGEHIPPSSPSVAAAQVDVATAPTATPQQYAEDPRAVCASLEQSIAAYDAQARQPQSAQTQDWISARRKETRDRQFRLRC